MTSVSFLFVSPPVFVTHEEPTPEVALTRDGTGKRTDGRTKGEGRRKDGNRTRLGGARKKPPAASRRKAEAAPALAWPRPIGDRSILPPAPSATLSQSKLAVAAKATE